MLPRIDFFLEETAHALRTERVSGGKGEAMEERISHEPLGVVANISAWNYPIHLTLAPLVGALAAGNTAVLKPSDLAPASAQLVADLVPRYLDEAAVQVVTDGAEETTALLVEPPSTLTPSVPLPTCVVPFAGAPMRLAPTTFPLVPAPAM